MPTLAFRKYHGLGNDFVVVDAPDRAVTAEAARRLCDRRRGIGADGVLSLVRPRHPEAEFGMHVFNADGSVAEMCGNGLRCVVDDQLRRTGRARTVIETGAGLREGWRSEADIGVTLGTASLMYDDVEVAEGSEPGTGISMGNPHLVLPLVPDSIDPLEQARAVGPALEHHAAFPHRVNVGFPRLEGEDRIRLVVFERGSGITDACGTGAGAAVTALARRGLIPSDRRITVALPGGPLAVEISGNPRADVAQGGALGEVRIIGEAVRVFEGEIELAEAELQPAQRLFSA